MSATWTNPDYNQYPVYLGSWVNWSRGRVFGATLTLTKDKGNLVIAFTALFVGFVSSRFWNLICFALHRHFSTPDARDALHHQRQAILRNSFTPELSLWTLAQLLLSWRRSAKRPCARITPILATASICICGFAVAGGFSSWIATAIGDEVLIASSNCGIMSVTAGEGEAAVVAIKYNAMIASNAANYAQKCYSTAVGSNVNVPTMFDCDVFAVGRLPTIVDSNAACPFNGTICRSHSNLVFDSGYIDSHQHFGINAQPDQRILFRQVFSCAPLRTRGYTQHRIGVYDNFTTYHYGSSGPQGTLRNFTWEALSIETQYPGVDEYTRPRRLQYKGSVDVLREFTTNRTNYHGGSEFYPHPELFRPDGDVSIIFFSGDGLCYSQQSTDDWYRATTPWGRVRSTDLTGQPEIYRLDEAAAPLACLDQYQFCRASLPLDGRCSPLGSFDDASRDAAHLFDMTDPDVAVGDPTSQRDTSGMAAIFQWFYSFLDNTGGPTSLVTILGVNSMLSQQTILMGIQLESPRDQWKRDVSHWWSTYLAILQTTIVQAAAGGINDPVLSKYRVGPDNAEQDNMCRNQKIRSRQHTSFSIFGICFTFVVGAIITIISYTLEPLFRCIDQRKHAKNKSPPSSLLPPYHRKDLEWITNDVLHLQCLSFKPYLDQSGAVAWIKFEDAIPVLQPGEHELLPLAFGDRRGEGEEKTGTGPERQEVAPDFADTTEAAVQTS